MRKLYRSSRDKKIFGVCGGLSEYLGVDATLLRILLIVVAVFSAGSVILVYVIAGFVIPRDYEIGGHSFGPAPNPYGGSPSFREPEPPRYGSQGWTPNGSAGVPRQPNNAVPPTSARPSSGIDAMMEDIEKKAMQREIEELKARITKFEKDSKGE